MLGYCLFATLCKNYEVAFQYVLAMEETYVRYLACEKTTLPDKMRQMLADVLPVGLSAWSIFSAFLHQK